MNNQPTTILVAAASIFLGVVMTLMAVATVANSKSCYAKWGDFRAEWGFWSGCMVEVNGVMVPEQVIRTIDDLK